MIDPEDGPGWEQQQDNEERRRFEEYQELLKADAEAYWEWLRTMEGQWEETRA